MQIYEFLYLRLKQLWIWIPYKKLLSPWIRVDTNTSVHIRALTYIHRHLFFKSSWFFFLFRISKHWVRILGVSFKVCLLVSLLGIQGWSVLQKTTSFQPESSKVLRIIMSKRTSQTCLVCVIGSIVPVHNVEVLPSLRHMIPIEGAK